MEINRRELIVQAGVLAAAGAAFGQQSPVSCTKSWPSICNSTPLHAMATPPPSFFAFLLRLGS